MALSALRANKLRATLTLLGMVIGVFAIIGSVTAVSVIDDYFQQAMSFLGTTTFTVERGDWERGEDRTPPITYDQVVRLEQAIGAQLNASPLEDFRMTSVRFGERSTTPNIRLFGSNQHYSRTFGLDIVEGRNLTARDVHYSRPVILLGEATADELFPNTSALEKRVRVDGRPYQVVGVLEEEANFLGVEQHRIIAPITTLIDAYGGNRNIFAIGIQVPSKQLMGQAMEQVIGHMRVIRGLAPGEGNDFELNTNETIRQEAETFTGVLTVGGAVIGLITLLASGIGIMNIMLVSVTERTREIGLRKAVGARRRDIMRQFLIEAFVLCLIGGLLGILLGTMVGNVVALVFDISPSFPWGWTTAALFMVTAVALIFGGYPAFKAARLDPIDALRYE